MTGKKIVEESVKSKCESCCTKNQSVFVVNRTGVHWCSLCGSLYITDYNSGESLERQSVKSTVMSDIVEIKEIVADALSRLDKLSEE